VRRGVGASSLASEDRACGPADLSRYASQPEALVPLRVLSLFAGIGGFDLGLERTGGFKTVAFCEIDPFCRRVLAKHWPEVPCYHDVRELTAEQVCPVDVICGGFPCQDLSHAQVWGKRAGLDGARSGLWSEYSRLIGELRPRFAVVENVSALLGRGAGRLFGELASLGYDAEWHCIPAAAIGAPHIRDRVWILAYPQHSDANGIGSYRAQEYDRRSESIDEQGCYSGSLGKVLADARQQRLEGCADAANDWTQIDGKQPRRQAPGTSSQGERPGSWWQSEPAVGRVAHGVPNRVDRLRCLGNAVVPQIPELIGRAILAAIADTHAQRGDGTKIAAPFMSSGGAKQSPKTCPS
jgi:DNA (cytosine-5)-methyltransferase 1